MRLRVAPVLILTAATAILVASFLVGQRIEERGETRFYLGGVQVNEPDMGEWVEALAAAGMNTVSVTDYAKQGDWDSANLWWETDNDRYVIAEIRAAEARGLHSVLVLRVALDHAFPRNEHLWHGMILPDTEEELDEWFRRYGDFVASWAEIAEREGVDALMLGSEMNALASTVPLRRPPALEEYFLDPDKQKEQKEILLAARAARDDPGLEERAEDRLLTEAEWARRTSFPGAPDRLRRLNAHRARLDRGWREIVAAARAHYDGPVGYAANFDQYREVGFWDALDVLGINAYFPLREPGDPRPLPAQLRAGWDRVLREISRFRVSRGLEDLPVLFTELGYVRRAGTTLAPWAGEGYSVLWSPAGEPEVVFWGEQPENEDERAAAVAALHRANAAYAHPFLEGILYWKLTTKPYHRDEEPFALLLGSGDPLEDALRRFGG
jgi:hypothetical protein